MTNKVTVRLVGGLGNQMHGYAFGMAIAHAAKAKLTVDCESGYWKDPYRRVYLLDYFPNITIRKKRMPQGRLGKSIFKLKLKAATLVSGLLPASLRPVILEGPPRGYREELLTTHYVLSPYFMGYWVSYRYYERIAAGLRRELTPPLPSAQAVLEVLEEIRGSSSCFIHWRSYLEEINGVVHPSMRNYYRAAVQAVRAAHPDVRFYVFSDNSDSARKELADAGSNLRFVDLKESRGDVQSLNDFYLMYACDHAIIGDSTFSWWAAWLGNPEGKKIVAPRGLPWTHDWIPPNWIGIDIH
jgi:hypothetical protein